MSDPVTNVEIEDVLSSIRRLVSDGDKARTRDPAPIEVEEAVTPATPVEAAEESESKPDKLVLTPAFMVVGQNDNAAAEAEVVQDTAFEDENDDPEAGWIEEISDTPEVAEAETQDAVEDSSPSPEAVAEFEDEEDPFPLTDMVWESVEDAKAQRAAALEQEVAQPVVQTPDRSELVATIAELEAAVSNDVDDFEPDGSETASDVMGQTIAWPGAVVRSIDDVEDADTSQDQAEAEVEQTAQTAEETPQAAEEIPAFEHRTADLAAKDEAANDDPAHAAQAEDPTEAYGDDDLDGLLEAGGVTLDEEALRAMVSDVVREELTGPLGERITRNVRKLVRREIYRILSSQEFD